MRRREGATPYRMDSYAPFVKGVQCEERRGGVYGLLLFH